jgi:hypothetical protein
MRDFDEGLLKVMPTGSSLPDWLLEEECACQRRTAGTMEVVTSSSQSEKENW